MYGKRFLEIYIEDVSALFSAAYIYENIYIYMGTINND